MTITSEKAQSSYEDKITNYAKRVTEFNWYVTGIFVHTYNITGTNRPQEKNERKRIENRKY